MTIIFVAPGQSRYLSIVRGLAERRGLTVSPARLEAEALVWAARQNGLSGRTARQFIDHLSAEEALAARDQEGVG